MTFSEIQSARELLAPHIKPSRLLRAESLTRRAGVPVFLKMESDLPTASFKPRGAIFALATQLKRDPVPEVIASSTGNHGAAVAYAAHLLGVRAKIFLPNDPNPVKCARIERLGAEIVAKGRDLSDAAAHAAEYAQRTGAYYLDDASDPNLPAGPATIACEIFEQEPSIATIYVPAGDTALIRSVAFAARHLRPSVRIVGVQAERAPSYYLSWMRGAPVPTDTCNTIADGLATRNPLPQNVAAIRELVDEMRLVSEDQMVAAIRWLILEEHAVAEPAGAAATAALLTETAPLTEPAAVLLTGANITEPVLRMAVSAA
jgi:threonine dehydratase